MTEPSQIATVRRPRAAPAARSRPQHRADHSAGWLAFAAVMVGLGGILNTIYGIAAISGSTFYVQDAKYVIGDLKTFGWILLALGVVQILASGGILAWVGWARWVGVASATLNALALLLFVPSYPFLALALFAVDLLVIYGLVAYGGRLRPAA